MNPYSDYKTTVDLKHSEVLIKRDLITGKETDLSIDPKRKILKDPTMKYYDDHDQPWSRTFSTAWKLLETQTTSKELLVAHKLAIRAKAYTNSLEPLNPDSSISFIAEELKESRNNIEKMIDKLFRLGVIGKFEVYNEGEHHQKYWIFNSFLSFNGRTIKKDVENLFSGTIYAKISNFN